MVDGDLQNSEKVSLHNAEKEEDNKNDETVDSTGNNVDSEDEDVGVDFDTIRGKPKIS